MILLLESFKKQANKLFEKYEIKIPLENKSVDELYANLAKIDRAMEHKILSDKAKMLF